MNSIRSYQHELMAAIFTCRNQGQFDERGLAVYRENLKATATQTLRITFPTVHQLIGDELLHKITEWLLSQEPPKMGDWAKWGATLPDIMCHVEALQPYPFVPDSARLDYVCHQLVRFADSYTDMQSLNQLQLHSPEKLRLQLNPSLQLLISRYPIAEIRAAHQLSDVERVSALRSVAKLMQRPSTFYIACYRDGYEVRVVSIDAAEYRWLKNLEVNSLDKALNDASGSEFDFKEWLLSSVQSNLLEKINVV